MLSFIKLYSASLIVTLLVGGGVLYLVNHTKQNSNSADSISIRNSGDSNDKSVQEDLEPTSESVYDDSTWITLENEYFSIDMPDTWKTSGEPTPSRGSAETPFVYQDVENGDYMFVVANMNKMGLEPVDQVWYWKVNDDGTGVVIDKIDEEGLSRPDEDVHGDGELNIMGLHTLEIPEQEINGHTYVFLFGNIKKEEGVDLDMFKHILASFQTKP